MSQIESWFEENKRAFPWREEPSPYQVWISEVMLQQTRAVAVVSYYLKWMELFPNVKALYRAPIERVIKAWEGLGYYSRARNLHAAAAVIVERFGGEIPEDREVLMSIPGLGPYTVGAILSFGFRKRAVAIDGNVNRVISRYFSIEENIGKSSVRRLIEERAESMLDLDRPWVTAEALIELGATVCLPKPRCEECPLQKGCLALRSGQEEKLPIKNEKHKTIPLYRTVLVVENEGSVLIKKGAQGKVMADLYEFPMAERGLEMDEIKVARALLGVQVILVQALKEQSHTFTRYKAYLSPVWLKESERRMIEGYEWAPIAHLSRLPFSSGHRKIADEVAFLSANMISSMP